MQLIPLPLTTGRSFDWFVPQFLHLSLLSHPCFGREWLPLRRRTLSSTTAPWSHPATRIKQG